ncbi:unnamed protein product [marine sediment metagenome]|uniref:Uncharacterized protein n=1 Tax=marine sediment metagenome TaxID=412755 RepID=X1R223_9ZZZZ
MNTRDLINEDDNPFELSGMQNISRKLDTFSDDERIEYRDKNASAIVEHSTAKILITSGPGGDKNCLSLGRTNRWFKDYSGSTVFAATFVQELVADLQSDIENNGELSSEQKSRIAVFTLYKLARSIVEKTFGISSLAIIFMGNC